MLHEIIKVNAAGIKSRLPASVVPVEFNALLKIHLILIYDFKLQSRLPC